MDINNMVNIKGLIKRGLKRLSYGLSILLLGSLTSHVNADAIHDSLAKATNIYTSNQYAFDKCRSLQAKPFDESVKKKKAIIIGDSQGCDFLNGILENGYLRDYQFEFRFIPYPCQTVPGEYISKYIAPKHRRFCTQKGRTDNLEAARDQVQKADLVIFAALWKPEVAEKLPQILNYLRITNRQKVVVVGNKFFGKPAISHYFHMTNQELRSVKNEVGTKVMEVNTILRRKTQGRIAFIDPQQLVCGNTTQCPLFTNNLRLISYDGRHLTKAGARYIGRLIFQSSVLGRI